MDLRTIVPNVAAVYISDAPHDPLAASRNRSEIFETNGEHLLDLLYDGLGREDDDPVVGAHDAAAARDHHLAVAHDGADDRALRQVQVADRHADDARGLHRLDLQHLAEAVADRVDRPNPAAPHMLQAGRYGDRPPIHDGIDGQDREEVGRESSGEEGCQYVVIRVVAVLLQ